MTVVLAETRAWVPICDRGALVADRGVCALVDGRHVAVFRLSVTDELVAIDNVDPFSGASVLSRGIVGCLEAGGGWTTYVASPLRKQRFDLRTGACLDDAGVAVDVFDVAVDRGVVLVSGSPSGGGRVVRSLMGAPRSSAFPTR